MEDGTYVVLEISGFENCYSEFDQAESLTINLPKMCLFQVGKKR